MYLFSLILTSFVLSTVWGTLTPSGSVPVDCGGQQTFTCTVTGTAGWAITGLMGITAANSNAVGVAGANARVTTTDTGLSTTSTIIITGFNTSDNRGVVQCVDISGVATVEGMATIAVGRPQCGVVGVDYGNDSCPAYTFTAPQGSVLPSTVMVSYQLVGDPSSAGSLNCSYPVDPQMCELVVPGGTYTVRLTPQNICGSPSSTCSSITESIIPNCNITVRTPPSPGCPQCWLLLLLLLLLIPVVYSISVAVVWHLYYKDYNYCQVYWCCCFCKPREGDGKIRTSSTEPMKTSPPPPRPPPVAAAAPLGEYADPKDVRKRKEENKIQYADLEFTKQSGGGQGSIHQKEQPVTYTAIQHA